MAGPERLKAAIRRFGIENDRFDDAVARRFGISLADLRALDHLQISGGMTPGQLAERLQLSSGAVTALVDRMERLDLVERRPHPSDRRSTLVCLSERTERFAAEAYEPFGRDMSRVAARLTPDEREALARFMDEAAEVAAEHVARQVRAQREHGARS